MVSNMEARLIRMLKYPQPGAVKTRLDLSPQPYKHRNYVRLLLG